MNHLSKFVAILLISQCLLHLPLSVFAQPAVKTTNFSPRSTSIAGAKPETHAGPINSAQAPGIPRFFFRTNLRGKDFKIFIRLAPGPYSITLGFIPVEPYCSAVENDVFHIYFNGRTVLQSFEPLAAVNKKCHKAIIRKRTTTISTVSGNQRLIIRAKAVTGSASLSFVIATPVSESSITGRPSGTECNGAKLQTDVSEGDHLAHSVPGLYSPVADRAGKGFARVSLDGGGSHTHLSNVEGSGSITAYKWTDDVTGKVLATTAKFTKTFPLGVTRIKLTVVDSSCASDEAYTDITVTGNQQPGAYCYYYRQTPILPNSGTLMKFPRPIFSAISPGALFSLNQNKFRLKNRKFVVRCIFFVEHKATPNKRETKLSLITQGTGIARLYRDGDLVVASPKTSGIIDAVPGTTSYEIIYSRTDTSKPPFLALRVDNILPSTVTHDQSSVLPIFSSIDPPSASTAGGANLRISGYGLYLPLKVRFFASGKNEVTVARKVGSSATQVFANAPTTTKLQGKVRVQVQSSRKLSSNALNFEYTSGTVCDDVKFDSAELKTSAGKLVPLNQPTSVAMGPDNKLYIGTRGGRVQVIDYNVETLIVKSLCYSHVITDRRYKKPNGTLSPRAILGLTFDPRDKVPRPYVSVSTLFWGRHNQLSESNPLRWANGAVERLRPGRNPKDQQQCLVYDKNIVSGLPVSDGDHSVNEMVFTQDGNLLIAVGGDTNLGLPAGKLGGRWESFFSASVVIAYLSRGNKFNGQIKYTTPGNSRTARPVAGYTDVQVYASGVRNLFSLQMARNGRIYAVDMGPNCGFGNASTTCNHYSESTASLMKKTFFVPTNVVVDKNAPAECRNGPGRTDKLLEIKKGKYYGHANLQRALLTGKSGECLWIDPLTGKVPGNKSPTPRNYEAPLSMVGSAKTGIKEYGAGAFCGKVRGDLILSQNSGQGSWRAQMDSKAGKLKGNPFLFLPKGGIRVEENVHGDLLFPRYFGKGVFVSRPRMTKKEGVLKVINAMPVRHGSVGGTPILIGGWGFGNQKSGVAVSVGGQNCPITRITDREIKCVVPKRKGSVLSVDVKVVLSGMEAVLEKAVLYMTV